MKLTDRELEVLRLICAGHTSKVVAKEIGLSYRTIEDHKKNIRAKLLPNIDVRTSGEALGVVAERMGLLRGLEVA